MHGHQCPYLRVPYPKHFFLDVTDCNSCSDAQLLYHLPIPDRGNLDQNEDSQVMQQRRGIDPAEVVSVETRSSAPLHQPDGHSCDGHRMLPETGWPVRIPPT